MRLIYSILFILFFIPCQSQESTYQDGESFSFEVSYGIMNAGHATLDLSETTLNNKPVYFAKGYGYTTGMAKMFFKVEDHYQSYFDKITGNPYKSVRKIHEGGYTRDQLALFDNEKNTIETIDLEKKENKTYTAPDNVQDVVSAFYFLRNHPKMNSIKEGETIILNMFFDDEVLNFKLKFLRREVLKTKFGKIHTMVFRPYVQKGRVFKESESLTMWISDDKNKVPLRIKADLLIGSLKADIEKCKGIKYPLNKL